MKSKSTRIQLSHLTGTQFKALIENAHEGIVLYDVQGRITYAAPAIKKITGYRESDVIGKTGTFFIHPDEAEDARKHFFKLLSQPGKSITLLQRLKHRNGKHLWCESRLTNFIKVPEINGIVSNFRDVTDRILAETQARKNQDLLETINRNLSEGIFMGVVRKEFVYANEAFLSLFGYRSFQQIAHSKPETVFASVKDKRIVLSELSQKKSVSNFETRFKRHNGEMFWGLLNVRLLQHEGAGEYVVGTIRDISREKESESQLLESRNFLDNIINTVPAPIFVKNEHNSLVTLNDKFCELVGRAKSRMVNKSEKELNLPRQFDVLWQNDADVLKNGKTQVREEQITFNGKTHDVLIVKARYINERKEKFVIASLADITHLKQAEQEVKRLHENLEGVLESSVESIFSVDAKLNYTAFNSRHKEIMKLLYNADIKIGTNKARIVKDYPDGKWIVTELKRALKGLHFVSEHYQDFPEYKGYIQSTYNPIHDEQNRIKGVAVFVQDITHRRRYEQIINNINANLRGIMESTTDGILAIDKNFRVIMFNNSYADGVKSVYGAEISVGTNFLKVVPPTVARRVKENALKAFSGNRVMLEAEHPHDLMLETSFNPIYDNKGEVTGAAMFIRNITERRRMEDQLKRLNLELTDQNIQLATQEQELKAALEELSERNFELDQLMYKTSHDLRSPLSSIIGLINLAHLDPDPSAFRHYLAKIEGRAKKLDEFIRSMLDYARVNRLDIDYDKVELLPFVNSCIQELEYMENYQRVKTHVDIKPTDMAIKSDRLLLKIIFSNIISNAYKYMNPEVASFLEVKIRSGKSGLTLKFRDNGIGIKEEYLPKIFNMFYRATDRSQGSGLGMYIVKQAVGKLGGKISLTSEYGKGTTFDISLPLKTT